MFIFINTYIFSVYVYYFLPVTVLSLYCTRYDYYDICFYFRNLYRCYCCINLTPNLKIKMY